MLGMGLRRVDVAGVERSRPGMLVAAGEPAGGGRAGRRAGDGDRLLQEPRLLALVDEMHARQRLRVRVLVLPHAAPVHQHGLQREHQRRRRRHQQRHLHRVGLLLEHLVGAGPEPGPNSCIGHRIAPLPCEATAGHPRGHRPAPPPPRRHASKRPARPGPPAKDHAARGAVKRPAVGELANRTKTAAMAFRLSPWTYTIASPTKLIGKGACRPGRHKNRFVWGCYTPGPAVAGPGATIACAEWLGKGVGLPARWRIGQLRSNRICQSYIRLNWRRARVRLT